MNAFHEYTVLYSFKIFLYIGIMNYHDNLYELLEVTPSSSKNEIRKAFCSKVKMLHPDTTGSSSERFTLELQKIIEAYRILMDDTQRARYDATFFKQAAKPLKYYIPQKRVRYSISLKDLLKNQFLPKKMRRKDIIHKFDHDIEIVCTQQEIYKRAIALVQLPSRILCPLCNGQHRDCYLCNGLGRIASPSTFEIELPGDLTKTTIITVDLSNYRPDTFTNLTVKFLRIKITIISP